MFQRRVDITIIFHKILEYMFLETGFQELLWFYNV